MKKVLIIDDHCDIRTACTEILELSNYHVLNANNAETGIEMAVKQQPDVILCCIEMTGMDGFKVLQLIKKRKETFAIPFVFITARTAHADFRHAMEMGADDYLVMPFDSINLLHTIEIRIKKHHRQSQYYNAIAQNLKKLPIGIFIKEISKLIEGHKIKYIRKKQILYFEGDIPKGIYLVVEGVLKSTKLAEDGRQFTTSLHHPDEFIGLDSIFIDEPLKETAEAVEDSVVHLLPKAAILVLLDKYPEIGIQFIKILSDNIRDKGEQLVEFAYCSVRTRLAQVLLRLSRKTQNTNQLYLSRAELATLAGISIETVSRTLSVFREEGLIEKDEHIINLIDVFKLSDVKN